MFNDDTSHVGEGLESVNLTFFKILTKKTNTQAKILVEIKCERAKYFRGKKKQHTFLFLML